LGTGGNAALFSSIAAGILSESASEISIDPVNTSYVPDSGPDISSRRTVIAGRLLADCCRALNVKRLKAVPPITVRRSYKTPTSLDWAPGRWKAGVYPAYCWEATVVEVDVDPVTLEPLCKGIWVSLDAGHLLLEDLARIRAEGGAVVDLGYVLSGEEYTDERLPSSFRYPFPRIQDIPKIEIEFLQREASEGAMGMKGMGDQPVMGVSPAYVLAVSQALGDLMDRSPLTPEAMQRRLHQLNEQRKEVDE